NVPDGNRTVTVGRSLMSNDVRFVNFNLPDLTVNIIDDEGALIVTGTEQADQIGVLFSPNLIQVVVNRQATFYPITYSQVLVLAGNGANAIQLLNPSIPVTVVGGSGSDKVQLDGQNAANTFDVDGHTITFDTRRIDLFDVESAVLNGKNFADTFSVTTLPSFA